MTESTAVRPDDIPVANLLRLAFYAGEVLEELEECEADRDVGSDFRELLAAMLARAAERVRRGGWDRGYSLHEDFGSRPRGRILIGTTIARGGLFTARLAHEFDELDEDTPDNRVLKAAAKILSTPKSSAGEDEENPSESFAMSLGRIVRELRAVSDVRLTPHLVGSLPRGQASRRYRVVRFVARLLVECAEPDEAEGTDWARRLLQDSVRMRRLFERFVLRYAQRHTDAKVKPTRYTWSDTPSPESQALMPGLHTDVVLRGKDWTRIVECKYTPRLFASGRHNKQQFHSAYLRQLFAYLSREAAKHPTRPRPSGLLLYPAVSTSVDHVIRMDPFQARVATLDLTLPWSDLRTRLDALLTSDT